MNLYRFYMSAGRMGELEGLFAASAEEINFLDGKSVNFGEVLGKHSEIFIDDFSAEDYLDLITDDSIFIDQVISLISGGHKTIVGYNPLDYIEDESWD